MMFRYLSVILFCLIPVNSGGNYGEFDLALRDYTVCNGAKRRSCVNETVTILNRTLLWYNATVKENATVVRAKIIGTVNDQELLRLRIKNVCEHMFIKPILQSWFSFQDQCGFYKGHYIITTDMQVLSRKFFGGKFMYGNWTINMLLYSDYCNVLCGVMQIELSPKTITD